MARRIRSAAPRHLLGTGLINCRNAGLSFDQATALHASFDFVSSHLYNGEDTDDHKIASAAGRPYFVGEAGFDGKLAGPDRISKADADIARWIERGASGYLQWGLMATSHDNGDGDRTFGVDPVFHDADFIPYQRLFRRWSERLEPRPVRSTRPSK